MKRWTIIGLLVIAIAVLLIGTMPMSIEEPKFVTVLREGDYEIRDYQAAVAAEVTVTGDQKSAAGRLSIARRIYFRRKQSTPEHRHDSTGGAREDGRNHRYDRARNPNSVRWRLGSAIHDAQQLLASNPPRAE